MLDSYKYTNGTASANIVSGAGRVAGIIVNSNTSGTFKLWDSLTATGTVICNTYTVPSGSSVITFPRPLEFYTGLFITVGGTLDFTIVTRPN